MSLSVQEPVHRRGRERKRAFRRRLFKAPVRGRLAATLSFSLLFHLSMITVFQIVIAFPREELEYYEVRIVSSPGDAPSGEAAAAPPRAGDTLALSGASLYDPVPEIALPVIEFAELERLRIRYDASEPLPEIEGLFDRGAPTDAWARFGGELQRLGRTLRDIALPGDEGRAARTEAERQRLLAHRPAEGFEAYVEWSGPPRNRELLFAPPIRALWEVNPDNLARRIEIVFKVNPGGRVINVWSPILDESGLVDDVQMTVLQYRFAPLSAYEVADPTAEQSGVLFIRAAEGRS